MFTTLLFPLHSQLSLCNQACLASFAVHNAQGGVGGGGGPFPKRAYPGGGGGGGGGGAAIPYNGLYVEAPFEWDTT